MHFVANSMDDVYRKLCGNVVVSGDDVAGTRELRNASFTLLDPTDSIASVRTGFSYAYMLGEMLWYFTGRNDVDFISRFSSFWSKISDDGETNNSAYGDIVFNRYGFDQLDQVIETLKRDPNSRRAIINFNVPNIHRYETKDEICTIAVTFALRHERLHCTAMMRSNDIWLGTPYDVVFFTALQQIVADELKCGLGTYTHFASSLHCYDRHMQDIKDVWCKPRSVTRVNLDVKKLWLQSGVLADAVTTVANPKDFIVNECRADGILSSEVR